MSYISSAHWVGHSGQERFRSRFSQLEFPGFSPNFCWPVGMFWEWREVAAGWWEALQRAQGCSDGTGMSPPLCCSTAWGLCFIPLLHPSTLQCSGFNNSSRNLCQLRDPAPSDTWNILWFHVWPRSATFTLIFNNQYSSGNLKHMDFKWGHPLRKNTHFVHLFCRSWRQGSNTLKANAVLFAKRSLTSLTMPAKGRNPFWKRSYSENVGLGVLDIYNLQGDDY